jgi:hypothetical protein
MFVERVNPMLHIGGQFVLPCHKIYIQPQMGTVLLFDATNICHGTMKSSGF